MTSACADISWHKSEKHEGRTREGLLLPSLLIPEKKRARNIGSKSKRLHIDSQDALELKLTWEEAQDLLRPPPAIKPSIVVIEDLEFEEYEVSNFAKYVLKFCLNFFFLISFRVSLFQLRLMFMLQFSHQNIYHHLMLYNVWKWNET